MNKRNTGKEKKKRNINFPYKHRRICIKCGIPYGVDVIDPSSRCPKCINKRDKRAGIVFP